MINDPSIQVHYSQQNEIYQPNQDLIRLRQMNQAFAKMNEHHLYEGYDYYAYQPQKMPQLQSFQDLSAQQGIEHHEHEQISERSNSLLFTLSEKDQEQTRPTTNVQNMHEEYTKGGEVFINEQKINPHNSQKFGSYEYDHMRSMTVNNTLPNNPFNINQLPPQQNTYQQQYFYNNSNDTERYHFINDYQPRQSNNNQPLNMQYPYMDHTPQNSVISNGFSKYEQFAIKISKLFNIQVEDLEVIYNQLKFQKQTQHFQHQQSQPTGEFFQTVQISDSEVMKKLFSYAVQIKNSHHKLKNMITAIDHRKTKYTQKFNSGNYERPYERPQQHIPHKNNNEIQNISINFMLEEESHQNRSKINHSNQKDDQTLRYQPAQNHFRNDSQNIQSKKTIIQKLMSQKGHLNSELVSQQTLQSHSSYAESALTNPKTSKSKKNSRVSEKIKLISEQLQSLKKEMDLEQEELVEEKLVSNPRIENHTTLFAKQQITQVNTQKSAIIQAPLIERNYEKYTYLPKMTEQKSQYIIQVNKSQNSAPPKQVSVPQKEVSGLQKDKPQHVKQSEFHTFGGQSFTYVRSIQELPMNDPEIDFKIQQTIKTCIVKSPSKKIMSNLQNNETELIQKTQQNTAIAASEKKSQKIIVEQGQTPSSRSKYSFRQNSQAQTKDNNETMITSPIKSQSREKMFKSIAEMRKSNVTKSKEKHQRGKTTNNAYLDDQQTKIDESFHPRNVFKNNALIQQSSNSNSFVKPKFFSKQVMRDGKLVFEKVQASQSQTPHYIRQPTDQPKKTATFGVISPSQTEKLLPSHSVISQINGTPVSSQSVSHNLIPDPCQVSKKMLSWGVPSSLYSAKTIESRPFLQSDHNLPGPLIRQPIHLPHNHSFVEPIVRQPYSYTPKMPQMNSNINNVTPGPINYQPVHQVKSPQKTVVFNQNSQETIITRPVTPITKIQNVNLQLNQKPRSFSVERIHTGQNLIQQQPVFHNKTLPNNSSHLKIITPPQYNQQLSRPNIITVTPVNERKLVQRPFSVPIRSMTPQRNTPTNFQQTLIEKPKPTFVQSAYKKEEPQTPVTINQFELKTVQQRKPEITQMINPIQVPQQKIEVKEQRPLYASIKQRNGSNSNHIQPQSPIIQNPSLNDSKLRHHQIQQQSAYNLPIYSPPIQKLSNNPRLQESEMYQGQLRASTKQSSNPQVNQNYQEMNLMSSRRGGESVVHTFPVQLEQSQKMNNSIYANEQSPQNRSQNKSISKPVYGQIITYQPPKSPKELLSPTNQTPRIPANFRPPKYIPLKEPQPITNNQPFENRSNSSQKLESSSKPPIKTYTMGHLLEASRTQKYMQESVADDRKSNTALNASNVAGRINDLYDSTPSFGRIQNDEVNSQSLVISPFSKEISNLNQSKNSSASKRSSSSRSRSNKKGIALQSKRNRTPSHQFFQSSYHH